MFLGDVPEVSPVTRALAEIPVPAPFRLRLAGGGRFGPVLWTGVLGDRPALAGLRDAIGSALLPHDSRPFQPHLTVSYRFDQALAAALDGYRGPSWSVTSFALYESRDGGYHRLWERPLST